MRNKGKWMIIVDGREDPRRFRGWKFIDEAIRTEIDTFPEECQIVVRKTTTSPTFWQCAIWSWKYCYNLT